MVCDSKKILGFLCLMLLASSPSFASKIHSKRPHSSRIVPSHASHHRHGKARVKKAGAWKKHGQHEIDNSRATAIQQALIREKYMTGEPSGLWDSNTRSAMAKYQAAQGWQAKRVPDARALIKLGLGPTQVANPATELAATESERSTGAAAARQ